MKFYYGSGSPFAWRVWLALEEKGVRYEHILLSFQAGDLKKPEYLAISPHGKVPALVDDDGTALYESQAILEYLEERYPEKPLLPRDPAGRAAVRIEEIEAFNYFQEAFSKLARQVFFTPAAERDEKSIADARANVRGILDALDARCAKRGKDFICGATFSRADCTWVPFVELAARAGVDLDPGQTPCLAAWRSRMRARPSYERTYPPHWKK
jgi:glutathione S-transferase